MEGVNKVILVGNLGKDPEVRYLESGIAVAKFSLATTETRKDRNTGERISHTEWHNVVVWRGLAEVAEKYLEKGSQIYVEGKLRNRQWEDQNGVTKYTTEVVCDNLVMMRKGKEEGNNQTENTLKTAETEPKIDTPVVSNTKTSPVPNKEVVEDGGDLPF